MSDVFYEADVTKNGVHFRATVCVGTEECMEKVAMREPGKRARYIHEATFPPSNLGTASKNEYARVMCASIADQWFRNNA